MSYYLRTLEGLARPLGALSLLDEYKELYNKKLNAGADMGTAIFKALQNLYALHPLDEFTDVYNYLYSIDGQNGISGHTQIVDNFISWRSRVKQQTQASAQASAQAAAYKAAMERKQQEEADAAAIEAEEKRIIAAQRAEQAASEQAAAYAAAREQGFEEPKTKEGENMEQINIDTQLITSGKEYTLIDETENTISYVDENGKLYIEQKAKPVWPWILAAVAGFFLLG